MPFDFSSFSPNYSNPDYASPQQIAAQREYAKQLMANSQQPVQHWTQGLSNIANALVGGYQGHQADVSEQSSNAEFARQLASGVRGGDLSSIAGISANPRMGAAHALLISEMLKPGGDVSASSGGANITTPSPSILDQYQTKLQGGMASPPPAIPGGPVPQQPPVGAPGIPIPVPRPADTSNMVSDSSGKVMPPGQNLTDPANTTISQTVQDAPIAKNPASPMGNAASNSLTAMAPALDALQDRSHKAAIDTKTAEAAMASNQGALTAMQMAKPKMAVLNQMKGISDKMEDSGYVPLLREKVKSVTGIMPGPNTPQYEMFDSLFKRLAPDAISEATASGRIPSALLQQINERGPQVWQDKETRNGILNSLAMPLDMHLRAGSIANQGGDPVAIQQRINNMQPYERPLDRPAAPTAQDIERLKSNPHMAYDFNAKFYPTTAEQYLK